MDYTTADLSARERAICDYAHKLTLTPSKMAKADVEALRAAGLVDAEILHVCLLASWFNYINRVADGLGVVVDDHTWAAYAAQAPIPWEGESASTRPAAVTA